MEQDARGRSLHRISIRSLIGTKYKHIVTVHWQTRMQRRQFCNDALHESFNHVIGNMQEQYRIDVGSPIGDVALVINNGVLELLDFVDTEDDRFEKNARRLFGKRVPRSDLDESGIGELVARYFAGECSAIERISARPRGTAFQEKVWQALRDIPCGETISYGELARRVGKPRAAQAVGAANGSNPVSIVHPCHRVIGADGSLTGYGGGLHRKLWLLEHEGATLT